MREKAQQKMYEYKCQRFKKTKKEEQDFHNKIYSDKDLIKAKCGGLHYKLRSNLYKLLPESIGFYEGQILRNAKKSKTVLELGAGINPLIKRIPFQANSQIFYVIDISEAAINIMKNDSKYNYINAIHGDATETPFGDNYFDLIFGKWILHHLDLMDFTSEMNRIIKPGGIAIFIEPMSNPIMNIYRRITPQLRTPTERPLNKKDLQVLHENFLSVTINGFHLLWFLAPFFHSDGAVKILANFEQKLLNKMSFLTNYCWENVIVIRKDSNKL